MIKTHSRIHIRWNFFVVLGIVASISVQCAKKGTPSGGAIDSLPPVVVSADPPNYSTNFDEREIRINFDEYIKLKDYQKQLIISPPLKDYIITPQGTASKFINIEIRDTLEPNTTYQFNFGQSIVDNNESNPYSGFKYVISTGSYIDSLKVGGVIKDAIQLNPDNFVSVMLYRVDSTFTDSIVYKEKPFYVTNTLDSLETFELTNLKEGSYALIGMKDEDANLTFQPKKDKIAFLKEFITVPTDSIYTLTLFKENAPYDVGRPKQTAQQRISFGYEGIRDSIRIQLVSKVPDDFESLTIKQSKADTLDFWYRPKPSLDSLVFVATAPKYVDTFTVRLRSNKVDSLEVKAITGSILLLNKPFEIGTSTPVVGLKDSLIRVTKDSLAIAFNTRIDTLKKQIVVDFKREEDTRYSVDLLPGAISDFLGATNDSLSYKLKTKEYLDYGDIIFNLRNAKNYPYILELVTDKEVVVDSQYITEGTRFTFNTIQPGSYYIRLVEDENANGLFDTGDYLKQQLPERVIYYPKLMEIRAGYLSNETFTLFN